MSKKYRALEKIEWPEGGRYVIVNAGEEFDEPPKEAGIARLIKQRAVERVTSGKADPR